MIRKLTIFGVNMENKINVSEFFDISPLALIRWVNSEYEEHIAKEINNNKILNQRAVRSILKILSIKNGINQNELARQVHLKGSTVSVALLEMEKCGYVLRRPSENDLRKINVFLTPNGYDLMKEIERAVERIENEMLASLSESEKANLKNYLFKILENT